MTTERQREIWRKAAAKYRITAKGKDNVKRNCRVLTMTDEAAAYAKKRSVDPKRRLYLSFLEKVRYELNNASIKPDYHLFPNTREGKVAACQAKVKEIKQQLKNKYAKKYNQPVKPA